MTLLSKSPKTISSPDCPSSQRTYLNVEGQNVSGTCTTKDKTLRNFSTSDILPLHKMENMEASSIHLSQIHKKGTLPRRVI